MGKKKSQQQKAAAAAAAAAVAAEPVVTPEDEAAAADEDDNHQDDAPGVGVVDDGDDDDDEFELLQVDLGDMIKLKQVLDESVAAALLEHVEEDYRWDNCKLILMAAACVFAMMAQFAPIPFPESRPVLGVCGSLYFFLSGILQLITTLIDKDGILLTKPVDPSIAVEDETTAKNSKNNKNNNKGGKKPAVEDDEDEEEDPDEKRKKTAQTKNKDLFKYGIRVRSSLPRFSEWYSITLEYRLHDHPTYGAPAVDWSLTNPHSTVNQDSPTVTQTWSVGQFFDKEGYFDEIGLAIEVDKVFARFEAQQYDHKTKTAKEETTTAAARDKKKKQ